MKDSYLDIKAMLAHVQGFMKELDTWHDDEAKANEIEEANQALSIDKRIEHKILLSWGGPSDGYKIFTDEDGHEVLEGIYFRADWGTYEEIELSSEETEKIASFYGIGI